MSSPTITAVERRAFHLALRLAALNDIQNGEALEDLQKEARAIKRLLTALGARGVTAAELSGRTLQ